ncbi:hypothetical protein PV04_05519 [Phialophora macrospora]|uniref:Uncharacterized protein n=1 Tax=Phialophora macrospora TaxID=1851006 RepID=A0A0D2FSZ6_9EURO|nr:hypothetical protein PV04_05519 [Phialophora macrospora]
MGYQPGPQATTIWAVSESRLITNSECECGNTDPESQCQVWELWESMSNTAEALAGGEYFGDAFDLHHLCFTRIFTNAQRLLLKHGQPVAKGVGHFMCHMSTSRADTDRPRALQLLIRAALGAARSCQTGAQSEHARLMLEAAGHLARQSSYPPAISSLLVLFGYYTHKLAELWPRGDSQAAHGSCLDSTDLEYSRKQCHAVSAQQFSFFIHPAILNREYLFWSTRLVTLPNEQEHTAPLLERELFQLGETIQTFLTSGTSPWDNCQERDLQINGNEFSSLLEFSDEVVKFLKWCTTTISESQTILEETYFKTFEGHAPCPNDELSLRKEQDEVQSILFWFLVWKWNSLGSKEKRIRPFNLGIPAAFVLASQPTTTLDAFFVLSELIYSATFTPDDLPTRSWARSKQRSLLSSHILNRIKHITMLPSRFMRTYLRRVVSFGLSSNETRRPQKSFILEKYSDFVILPSPTEELTLRVRAPDVPTANSALEQAPAIEKLSLTTTEAATGCLHRNPMMSSPTSTRAQQSQSSPVPVGSPSNSQGHSGKPIYFYLKSNPQTEMKGTILSVEKCSCLRLTYIIERRTPWNTPYGPIKYGDDEIEICDHPLPHDFAAQNLSYLTNSSSMSIDTKAFRRDARRLNGQKTAKRALRHDVEMSSPLRLSKRSWDFEQVTGLPARPPDGDAIMEEAAEQWSVSARPSTPALPGHEPVSSFADWHSFDMEY